MDRGHEEVEPKPWAYSNESILAEIDPYSTLLRDAGKNSKQRESEGLDARPTWKDL